MITNNIVTNVVTYFLHFLHFLKNKCLVFKKMSSFFMKFGQNLPLSKKCYFPRECSYFMKVL